MVNNLGPAQVKIRFAEHKTPAIGTACLILLCVLMFYLGSSGKMEFWLAQHSFQPVKAIALLGERDYSGLVTMLCYCNFASINIWQMLINIYFLGIFGLATEKTLGLGRFSVLMLLGCTIPWAILAWDASTISFKILPWESIY
jgi:membrane associated rhomboid family serine protease